jgi:ABC-2 type transport system permease protein
MRNVWTIAKREYEHYFISPIAYIVAFLNLFVIGLIFALDLLTASQSMTSGYGAYLPSINSITGTLAFLFMLATPALTMRLISDEIRGGTMELLLTAPIRDWELVLGKWLGAFLFLLSIIAITFIYPFLLNSMTSPGIDQMQMVAAYLAVILVGAAFLGLGVGISAAFSNQIAAFFATLSLFVLLWWLVGFPARFMQGGAADVFNYLNLTSHLDSLSGGNIIFSDIVYFLSLTALGLFTGVTAVETRRWR